MPTIVLKPFHTLTQRFPIGAPVTEAHDLTPFSFDYLKKRGFIGAQKSAKPAAPDHAPDPAPAS